MKYRVRHLTKYTYTDAVPVCHNLVHLAPRTLINQNCDHFELNVCPAPNELVRHTDVFGNFVDYFAIQDPHRTLCVTAVSEVNVTPSLKLDQTAPWEAIVADASRRTITHVSRRASILLSIELRATERRVGRIRQDFVSASTELDRCHDGPNAQDQRRIRVQCKGDDT